MSKRLTLILGGARSGKSTYALRLVALHAGPVLFVATAEAGDAEMASHIAAHKAGRPASWRTIEAPLRVGEAIRENVGDAGVVLLDCLTLLTSNALLALPQPLTSDSVEAALRAEIESLLAAYGDGMADWIIVSNEVGWGLVPSSVLGRLYRDALGRANQLVAQMADEVILLVAGLPMTLKLD